MCDDCEDGYFWDSVYQTCAECTVTGCTECSDVDECDTCASGLLLEADSSACIEYFTDCVIPINQQPARLSIDDDGKYYCGECDYNQYFDDSDKSCLSCSGLSNGCLACGYIPGINNDPTLVCFACDGSKIVNDEGECEQANIPNCDVLDPNNGYKCLECNPFYSLNPARTACVSCEGADLTDGCLSCFVDRYNNTANCTACIGNLNLDGDNNCVWDSCSEFITANAAGNLLSARCTECEEGFGLDNVYKICVPCTGPGKDWSNCLDCSVSQGEPVDCSLCADPMTLMYDTDTGLNYCDFSVIDNCVDQLDTKCLQCADGFWRQTDLPNTDYDACAPCDIEKCTECESKTVVWTAGTGQVITEIYPTCIECLDSFYVVDSFLDNNEQIPVQICAWDYEITIDNCLYLSLDDISICAECSDTTYWNAYGKTCDQCSNAIPNCNKCDASVYPFPACTEC